MNSSSSTKQTGLEYEKLNGENYHTWKWRAKMHLVGKELWDVVDGAETLDETASEKVKKEFKKKENLSLSLICLSVCSNLDVYV